MNRRKFLSSSTSGLIGLPLAISMFSELTKADIVSNAQDWQDYPGTNGGIRFKVLWIHPDSLDEGVISPAKDAKCMLFKFAPNFPIPKHAHPGGEVTFVYDGYFKFLKRNRNGLPWDRTMVVKAGDMVYMPENSIHEAAVAGPRGVITLNFTLKDIKMLG